MKYIRTQGRGKNSARVFSIETREKEWFVGILRMFPVVEASYHKISRDRKIAKAEQELLETSMAERKDELRSMLDNFLSGDRFVADDRFSDGEEGAFRFSVTGEQCEWLLQILNDVRVGSWTKLGCPEMDEAAKLAVNPDLARYVAAMDLSGYFQMALLQAFNAEA
jgi:hypothetical protein